MGPVLAAVRGQFKILINLIDVWCGNVFKGHTQNDIILLILTNV